MKLAQPERQDLAQLDAWLFLASVKKAAELFASPKAPTKKPAPKKKH